MINFIVNPNSGKGKGKKYINKISEYCKKHEIEFTSYITTAKGDAVEFARQLSQSPSVIVAVGGDGTFHEVLNGIVSFENTLLGFIPAGNGNDFARTAGLHKSPIKALKDILNGEQKNIDYIAVGEKRCLNVTGTGLDIEVLKRTYDKKCSYLSSLIYNLKNFDPYNITAIVNGETLTRQCVMIGVCNGKAFGGGMKISPLSEIDDGTLDVIIINMPKSRILPLLIKFVRGKHLNLPITEHIKCDNIKILTDRPFIQLDGEIYSFNDYECSIVKGGLHTFKTTGKHL